MNYRFNYIITIYNKEKLIARVLQSVIDCAGPNSQIYPVLDGCTDRSEQIIDQIARQTKIPIHKVYTRNVHEILSLNAGYQAADQSKPGFNITLQDDVVLNDPLLESKIIQIYTHFGYPKIGVLAFRCGVNAFADHTLKEIACSDLEESVYGTGGSEKPILPGEIIERMIAIGSPECISTYIIQKVGIYDPRLAPHAYHTHDYCLRTLQKGYRNYVFSLAFQSEINWGGTRENPHPHKLETFAKNRRYLYQKHHRYLDQLQKQLAYFKKQKTYLLIDPQLNNQQLKRLTDNYYRLRKYVLNEDLRGKVLVFLVKLIGRENIIKIKKKLGLKI